jgi:hypothetical protein
MHSGQGSLMTGGESQASAAIARHAATKCGTVVFAKEIGFIRMTAEIRKLYR